ncbi:TPA: hypothetical protein K8N27_001146 [Clostridium perfringens]|nr:hypothetical protein [Clostridium perfringens]
MDKKDEIYKKVKKVLIKISIVIGIIILFFLFIIVPIKIFFLLKIGFEKGAEDSWAIGLGFYGALLGGLGTIIAFLVTSYQTNKIQKENVKLFSEDKRLTIKPYIDLSWNDTPVGMSSYIINANSKDPILLISNLTDLESFQCSLGIKNLGLGPAIDVQIIKITSNNIEINLDETTLCFDSININTKKFFNIYMAILNTETQELYGNKNEIEKKYTNINILDFKIVYKDILDNKYEKIISLKITINPVLKLLNNEDLYVITDFKCLIEENNCCETLKKRSI